LKNAEVELERIQEELL